MRFWERVGACAVCRVVALWHRSVRLALGLHFRPGRGRSAGQRLVRLWERVGACAVCRVVAL